MNISRKQLLIIGGITLLILIVGAVIGLVFWNLSAGSGTERERESGNPTFGDTSAPAGESGASAEQGGARNTFGEKLTTGDRAAPRLWRVAEGPVSAATAYASTTGTTSELIIRYLERGTGHIFEQEVERLATERLSNNRFTGVQHAVWFPADPDRFVIQYLDQSLAFVRTYLGTLTEKPAEEQQQGSTHGVTGTLVEPQGRVSALAPAPDSGELFYLLEEEGSVTGKIRSAEGEVRPIYPSPFHQATVAWNTPERITLTTAATRNAPGAILSIDATSGQERPLLHGDQGLLGSRSPDGDRLLYLTFQYQPPALEVEDLTTGEVVPIAQTTLPEKCVWGRADSTQLYCAVPRELLRSGDPDAWYQGRHFYTDNIWRFDAVTGEAELLAQVGEFVNRGAPEGVDGIQLTIDPSDSLLTFVNKRTGALWALRLTDETSEETPTDATTQDGEGSE
ncbi:hypothetical protein GVX82_03110 [Patescibacteria group bacterium]|jgi:hypothetical protein|nr:hypothetical protein [Patescibacteria group bacterium]